MRKVMRNNIQRACWLFNEVSNPAALRTDSEHRRCRKAQRNVMNFINRYYREGCDYKEFSNGMLFPIN